MGHVGITSNRRFESDACGPALRAYARAPQPERWAPVRIVTGLCPEHSSEILIPSRRNAHDARAPLTQDPAARDVKIEQRIPQCAAEVRTPLGEI